jgi:hypothetical protein
MGPCAPTTIIADSQVTSKGSTLCASSSVYHHLYPPAISSALDRSESPHQAYHRRHHGARRCPQPMRAHKPRPLSRPCCAMPLRLVGGYAVDEHHYTGLPLRLLPPSTDAAPKTMFSRGRAMPKHRHRQIQVS